MISTPALLAFLLAAEPGAAEASVSVRLADGRPAARLSAGPVQLGPCSRRARNAPFGSPTSPAAGP